MLEDPVLWAAGLPWLVLPALILFSSAMEFVIPPFWGDTILLLSFFLAGQGVLSPVTVFVLGLVGSILGAAAAWEIGRRYGMSVVFAVMPKRRHAAGRRILSKLEHFGEPALAANRFLPVIRAFALFVAGTLKLRFVPSMAYNAISSALWLGFLMSLGLWTAGTWEDLVASARRAQGSIGIVALVGVAAVLLWTWMRTASEVEPLPEVNPEAEG